MAVSPFSRPATQAVGRLMVRLLGRTSFDDLVTSRHHSRDFDQVRADYIFHRVQLLALALAAGALLWIPMDFGFLESGRAWHLLYLRLGFVAGFLGLGLGTWGRHSARWMRWRMAFLVLIPSLFYGGSLAALGGEVPGSGVLVGYTFLPFLIAALLGLFPLTFKEGAVYAAILLGAVVGADVLFGTLLSLSGMRDLWLLVLLFVVAFWGQLSQLDMLLRLHREATRDALTGLVNRRVLMRWLDREIQAAQASEQPVSVLLFDLDLFKRINDVHGHLTGDRVLQAFAAVLEARLPASGLAGRYGGEEFIAILPGIGEKDACAVAEGLREAWRTTAVFGPQGDSLPLSVSIGVAELRPGDDPDELVSRVDDGLYRAKESGRDMVVQAE